MPTIETCDHWTGYRIPTDAALCPGCGRRHAPRTAVRPRRAHSPLLRRARLARWLLVLSGWACAAFGVAAVARFVIGLDEVVDDLDADVPGRVGDVAHGVGLAAAGVLVLAVAATVTWSRRAHRNLAALDLTDGRTSAWALGGWLVPGRRAMADKRAVDSVWRESSPVLAALPDRGWSRNPVSRVVLHWWTLWLAVPAAGLLAAALVGGADDLHDERALLGLAGSALAVAATRALYDVVGLVTVAQAHRADAVLRDHAEAVPWSDDDAGWSDEPDDDADEHPARLEPLRR